MRGKIFTRTEADGMVPLIRRIVVNVRSRHRLLEIKQKDLARMDEHAKDERRRLEEVLDALESQLDGFVRELEDLGCVLRDPARGLVECFGEFGGQIVYFAWRPGSPSFTHWHALDASPLSAAPLPLAATQA